MKYLDYPRVPSDLSISRSVVPLRCNIIEFQVFNVDKLKFKFTTAI